MLISARFRAEGHREIPSDQSRVRARSRSKVPIDTGLPAIFRPTFEIYCRRKLIYARDRRELSEKAIYSETSARRLSTAGRSMNDALNNAEVNFHVYLSLGLAEGDS